jgi:hypothetical protein
MKGSRERGRIVEAMNQIRYNIWIYEMSQQILLYNYGILEGCLRNN